MPTILVADDNRNIHKMVESALKDLGYKIESVGNGEHAVQKLPSINPDLILADIYMPVRNGYEVCEFVKNNEKFAHIPVVLLQGKFDPLDEHKMRSARADGLLMKPFVPADPLVKMVTDLLEEAAAKRPASEAGKGSPEKTVELTPAEVAAATGESAPAPEPEIPDYAVQPPKIEIREEDKMLAFGDLLSSPAAEEERRPKSPEREGFRASSIGDEDEGETEASAKTDEVDEAEEKARSFGGILEEAKQPSPDEPPIKVEFSGTPEPMELVTEDPKAEPAVVDAGPLPELATSPDEWMSASAPAVSVGAEKVEGWEATPPAAEPLAPTPEIVVAPEPETLSAPAFSSEPPPLAYEKPKLEELSAPPAPADSVLAESAAPPAPGPVLAPPPAAEPPVAQVISMPAPAEPDAALVDAIVEKVVARLQPQVVDKIARELVRPIAEALLKKEEKK